MKPLIKWPGGKSSELKYINSYTPNKIKNYYEPFQEQVLYILILMMKWQKDISVELINFYLDVKNNNKILFSYLYSIVEAWKLIDNIVDNNKKNFYKLFLVSTEEKENYKKLEKEYKQWEKNICSLIEQRKKQNTKQKSILLFTM